MEMGSYQVLLLVIWVVWGFRAMLLLVSYARAPRRLINKKKVGDAELSKRIFVLCRSTIFDTVVCIVVDCRMLGMLWSQERVEVMELWAEGWSLPYVG
jgi:hypothetical protein